MKNKKEPATANRRGCDTDEHGGRRNEVMKTEGGSEKRHTRGSISKQNRKQEKQFTVYVYFLIWTFQLVSPFDDS